MDQIWNTSVDGGEGLIAECVFKARWPDGTFIHFDTPVTASMQLGYMRRTGNVKLHKHVQRLRKLNDTCETLIVLSGRMLVKFYSSRGDFITTRTFGAGDAVIFLSGGHAIEFNEPTELYEVKQGPYETSFDKVLYEANFGQRGANPLGS